MECWIADCYFERAEGSYLCAAHLGAPPPSRPVGPRTPCGRGEAQAEVLGVLVDAGMPLLLSEIASATGRSLSDVFAVLARLRSKGRVKRSALGVYEAVPQ